MDATPALRPSLVALRGSEGSEESREEVDERRNTSIPVCGNHLKGKPNNSSTNLPSQYPDTPSQDGIITGENIPGVPNEHSVSGYKFGSKASACVGVLLPAPLEVERCHRKAAGKSVSKQHTEKSRQRR